MDMVMPILLRADQRAPVVLQVLPSLVTGGVERGTLDMAEALVAAEAIPLVASEGGPLERELKRLGVEHIKLPLASKNPLVMRANVGRLARLIDARKVDILHARSRAPAWSARAAARRQGCRFVTTFHSPYGSGSIFKRRYNAVMADGDRVIAISDYVADLVRRRYKVTEPRLATIHRGVDLRQFHPEQVSAERIVQLASDWRITADRPVVMLPGRLSRWKGQEVLLRALARLKDLDFTCVLVGSDQGRSAYRRELEGQIERLGLAAHAFIVDHCRDMPAAYMLADVVVSASQEPEGFGRVVAEAQAMGRPIVVSAHGGALEQIVEGETGFSFAPGKTEELAAALRRALGLSAEERSHLANRAIARVGANYSKTLMCWKTLEIYQELLTAPRSAAAGRR